MYDSSQEIFNDIENRKNALIGPEPNSQSGTANWRKWARITADLLWTFLGVQRQERADLVKELESKRIGLHEWYIQQVKKFQLGDILKWDSELGLYYYEVIDESKQIIDKVSLTESSNQVLLFKLAKKDGQGNLVPLDAVTELPLADTYVKRIAVPGVAVNTLSQVGDVVDGRADLYYDGSLSLSQVKGIVAEALTKYRDSVFSFDGRISRNALIDTLRETTGIHDVYFNDLTGTPQGGAEQEIARYYDTGAGYFNYAEDWLDDWNYFAQ